MAGVSFLSLFFKYTIFLIMQFIRLVVGKTLNQIVDLGVITSTLALHTASFVAGIYSGYLAEKGSSSDLNYLCVVGANAGLSAFYCVHVTASLNKKRHYKHSIAKNAAIGGLAGSVLSPIEIGLGYALGYAASKMG